MDNYEIARNRARESFLGFDQEAIVRRWKLAGDGQRLYVDFLGRPYAIRRETGEITRLFDGCPAGFSETLSIFDLLCHPGENAALSGSLAPVNSLKNGPKAGGVGTDFHREAAKAFDRNPQGLRRACLALGGTEAALGDMGFRFPVFRALPVVLKFYRGDEEFPPSLTLLWDENMLQFVFYETVFYIGGFLLDTLREGMGS